MNLYPIPPDFLLGLSLRALRRLQQWWELPTRTALETKRLTYLDIMEFVEAHDPSMWRAAVRASPRGQLPSAQVLLATMKYILEG